MDRRQKVAVFARVAPQRLATSSSLCAVEGDDVGKTVELRKDDSTRTYSLDGVFPSTTSQADVYARVGADLVADVLNGFHSCALAYGQTGTGKTWTIAGPRLSQQSSRGVLTGGTAAGAPAAIDDSDGLLPRMLVDLLQARDAARAAGRGMTLHLAYLQLYCEELQDLLVGAQPSGGAAAAGAPAAAEAPPPPPLVIREHPRRGVYVQGLSWHAIGSLAEAIRLLDHGAARRAVAATRMNAHSSRSHAVVMIRVQQQQQQQAPRGTPTPASDASIGASVAADGGAIAATLTVVDLAGSERAKKSLGYGYGARDAATSSGAVPTATAASDAATPSSLTPAVAPGASDDAPPLVNIDQLAHEMRAINVSLTALGNVIAALATRSDAAGAAGRARSADPSARGAGAASTSAAAMPAVHVPYRNSALTRLLQNCLGGNARTSLVVTVSPDPASAGETQSTLEFASRASRVRIAARRADGDAASTGGCARHRKQIAQLRKAVDQLEAEVAALQAQLRAAEAGRSIQTVAGTGGATSAAVAPAVSTGGTAASPRAGAAVSESTSSVLAARPIEARPGSASTDDGIANEVIIDGDSDSDGDDFDDAPAAGAAAREARAAHLEAARLRAANAALELRLAGALSSASQEQERSSAASSLHASLAQSMRHLAASFSGGGDAAVAAAAGTDAPPPRTAALDAEAVASAGPDLCSTIDDDALRAAAAGLPPQLATALIEAHKAWQRQLEEVDRRARAHVAAAEARAAAVAAAAREQIAAAEADRDTARDELLAVLQQYRQSRTALRVLQKDSLVQIAEAVDTIEATRLRLESVQAHRDELAARCTGLEAELRSAKTQLQAAAATASAVADDADARAALHELNKLYAARMETITERVKYLERERERDPGRASVGAGADAAMRGEPAAAVAAQSHAAAGGDRWSQALDAAAAAHATVTTRLKRAASETETATKAALASGSASAAAVAAMGAAPRVLVRAASASGAEVVAGAASAAVGCIPPLRVSTAAATTRTGAASARAPIVGGASGSRASLSAASTPMGAGGGGFVVAAGALPSSADMLTANLARLRQLPPVLTRQPSAGGGRGGGAAAGLVRVSR